MSELTDAINTGIAVAGCLGGGLAWLWARVEKMNRRVKSDLEACEDARNTQLIVIELFWRALEDLAPQSRVLIRARSLLDESKLQEQLRKAKDNGHG